MKRRNARGSYKWYKKESEENSMEGRGRSRRRNTHQAWKKRLSSVLAVVLTAVMILNMPLSIDGLRMHVSDAFASASNADRDSGVWATASNAKYRKGDSGDVDIYVIADDNGAVPGNTTSMTLYLKNNTDQAISEGVLTFSGRYINKEDAIFQDVGSGEEYEQIIAGGGPGQAGEESGEGLIYQESEETADETMAPDAAESIGSADEGIETTDPVLPEDSGSEGDEEEEEAYKLTNIDLLPGELHEVHFEFYTDDDVKSTKANVSFSFRGENEEGSRVTGDTKFYYSIGLPTVNFSMEDGMQIESGISNDLEIWMSEPDWVDEDLQDRLDEQEEKEEEENDAADTASDSDASKASDSNASKDNTASDSNAGKDSSTSQKDEEKIQKYTEEAMEISSSRVSYTVEIYGADYSEFHPRKAEEAEDIGWISCVYEVDRNTKPGIYYGKVTATGKWNKKSFTSEQGFLFEVTGEGIQEYTEETDNVIVRASAPASVFDEEVKLVVKELPEGSDGYQEAEEALKAEDVLYEGMKALDITFVNEDGEEIEPNGEVQVSIQMKEGVLPEDADLETVEVHHLKAADANTVKAEAVADGAEKTDGTVLSAEEAAAELEAAEISEEEVEAAIDKDAAAVAMFSVDSFSTFTITWGSRRNTYFNINLKYVDESGTELRGKDGSENIEFGWWESSKEYELSDYADSIDGYQYSGSQYEGKKVTRFVAAEQSSRGGTSRTITFYNRDEYVGRVLYNSRAQDINVQMIYSPVEPLDTFEGEDTEGTIYIGIKDYTGSEKFGQNNEFVFGGTGWTGNDGGVKQGLVQSTLTNGAPVLKSGNDSLSSLFSGMRSTNKLLQLDNDGYYYYDSSENFAHLRNNNDFELYNTPRNLDENVPPSFPLFLPFNTIRNSTSTAVNDYAGDPNNGKRYTYYDLGSGEKENYYFGMEISFDFIMPENGELDGQDMVFEFAGDDDVWVFIDDVLVLDMGGVHDNYGGSINFATGQVLVDKVNNPDDYGVAGTRTTIGQMFQMAGKDWDESDYSTHTLKFFYMERGGGGSNCKIRFNMPPIPQGTINFQKELSYSNAADAADFDFEFEAYVDYEGTGNFEKYNGSYKLYDNIVDYGQGIYSSLQTEGGIIKLKDGQIAQLDSEKIQVTSQFYLVEKGALSEKYDITVANTTVETIIDDITQEEIGVRTGELEVGDNPFVVFTNAVVVENQFNLEIHKQMEDGSTPEDEFTMNLLLGTSKTPYKGEYTVYHANGTSSKKQAEGGSIILKAGEHAEVVGLVGGNLIEVREVALGDNYGQPSYTMTGSLAGAPSANEVGVSGTVLEGKALEEAGGLVKVEVTNRRKPSVTIEKQVEGNMGDRNAEFSFTISVKDSNGMVDVDGTYDGIEVGEGKFILKDDDSFTIPNLPVGSQITVTEITQGDGYTTTVTAGDQTGDNTITISPNGAVKIIFTNTKGVNIPTGFSTNNYPYLLMLAIAAVGTASFIYPACRRRRSKGDK